MHNTDNIPVSIISVPYVTKNLYIFLYTLYHVVSLFFGNKPNKDRVIIQYNDQVKNASAHPLSLCSRKYSSCLLVSFIHDHGCN